MNRTPLPWTPAIILHLALAEDVEFAARAANNHAKLLEALEALDAHIPDREGLQPVDAEVKAFLNHESLWRAKESAREAVEEARK